MPRPRKDEKKKEFISRCMGENRMREEFPKQEQRAAVCYGYWRKKGLR